MATIVDHMIASGEKRTNFPSFTVGSASVLSDPEKPSFVSDRQVAQSQFHYLEKALVGPKAEPPGTNPVWRGLMDAAGRIRTQQSADPARDASPSIPDEAVSRTGLLMDVGIKRMAVLGKLDETSPNQGERNSVLRGTGAASIEGALHDREVSRAQAAREPIPRSSAMARVMEADPGTAKLWETDESRTVRTAVRGLMNTAGPEATRAIVGVAASEAVTGRRPGAEELGAVAGMAEAWDSPQGRKVRQSMQDMDRVLDGGRKAALGSAILGAANEEGFSGRAPKLGDMARMPGFKESWESEAGRDLRTSMGRLGTEVQTYVRDELPKATPAMTTRPGQDGAKSEARETYDRWSASAPSPAPKGAPRWTEGYQVVMDSGLSSRVTQPFVDMALRAHDTGRNPTRDELVKDVSNIRSIMSQPEKAMLPGLIVREMRTASGQKNADGTARTNEDGTPHAVMQQVSSHGIREVTVRPPIVGKDPYAGHLIGLEGQAHYSNKDAVRGVMERSGPRATFVSYAEPGKDFRDTLTAAAGEAGIPVVKGSLAITSRSADMPNSRVMTHVDSDYMAPSTRIRINERQLMVPGEAGWPVPMDSKLGREATRGSLVIVDVETPETRKQIANRARGEEPGPGLEFIARLNNGALGTDKMFAFGGSERSENNIFKMAQRRDLSEMAPPTFIDKTGTTLGQREVAMLTQARGMSRGDERVEAMDATRGWKTSEDRTHMLVAAMIPGDTKRQSAFLNGFATIGDGLDAVASAQKTNRSAPGVERTPVEPARREALWAAAAYSNAASNPNTLSLAVERVDQRQSKALDMNLDTLADPREKAVARTGTMLGFSTPSARNAPEGSRYAIIGDEGPASPAMANQINTVMAGLAKLHGRDENGVAMMRINTTLTTGVGEEVMKAGLRNKVPVEAYGGKDDRDFKRGTDDMRLLANAAALEKAGLGGTWSLSPHDESRSGSNASRERTARAAIEGSDAVVVSRIGGSDPLKLVVAAAGRDKPVAILPATSNEDGTPDVKNWAGTAELGRAGAMIRASIPTGPKHDPSFTASGASLSPSGQMEDGKLRSVVVAEVSTGKGAMQLTTSSDLGRLKSAASGDLDMRMGRDAPPEFSAPPRSAPAPAVRWEVVQDLDLDRYGDKKYRESLKLTPVETKLADATHRHYAYSVALDRTMEPPTRGPQEPITDLGKALAGKFAVTETKATRAKHRAGGGMEA